MKYQAIVTNVSNVVFTHLIVLFLSTTSFAATYTVAQDGTGDFADLPTALRQMVDGDQLTVQKGTYLFYQDLLTDPLPANIHIRGEDAKETIIDAGGHAVAFYVSRSSRNITISDLTIQNATRYAIRNLANGLTLQNNIFQSNTLYGLWSLGRDSSVVNNVFSGGYGAVLSGYGGLQFRDNVVENTRWGVYAFARFGGLEISDNTFTGNRGAILVLGSRYAARSRRRVSQDVQVCVTRNVIKGGYYGCVSLAAAPVELSYNLVVGERYYGLYQTMGQVHAIHNTIVNSGRHGMRLSGVVADSRIHNNILAGNRCGVTVTGAETDVSVISNLGFDNAVYDFQFTSTVPSFNHEALDPEFDPNAEGEYLPLSLPAKSLGYRPLIYESLPGQRRGLWIWSMASKIILDEDEQLRLWSFVTAPHGRPEAKITTLFMSFDEPTLDQFPDAIRAFLIEAHSRGVDVHFLTGDPVWSLNEIDPFTGRPFNDDATRLLQKILDFNTSYVTDAERFDGFQQDTEPYLLSQQRGHPYSWNDSYQRDRFIWPQYTASLLNWQDMVDDHNAGVGDDLVFGVAIPYWWQDGFAPPADHRIVQNIVDYVAVMSYNTRDFLGNVQQELLYADTKGYADSVYVGFETVEINWKEDVLGSFFKTMYIGTTSYFYLNNETLEEDAHLLSTVYENSPSLIGPAIHFYEDAANGETSYRSLDLVERNHAPSCLIYSVNHRHGNDILIRYKAQDADQDELSVLLFLSYDQGNTWFLLPLVDSTGDLMMDNDGMYRLDRHFIPEGVPYTVRLEVTENTQDRLKGLDFQEGIFSLVILGNEPLQPDVDFTIHPSKPTLHHPVTITWQLDPPSEDDKGFYYDFGEDLFSESVGYTRAQSVVVDPVSLTSPLFTIWPVRQNRFIGAAISTEIQIWSDIDGDGIADVDDPDRDGDGISNADEVFFATDADDPLSYPDSLILGEWNFDNQDLSGSTSGQPALEVTQGTVRFETSGAPGEYTLRVGEDVSDTTTVTTLGLAGHTDITPLPISALTIEMMIKPDVEGRNVSAYIPLAFEGDMDQGLSWILQNDAKFMSLRFYRLGMFDAIGSFQGINVNNFDLFDGQWHHVAMTYNGYDRTIRLYVDHRIVAEKTGRGIPEQIHHPKALRLFDARSDFDSDNKFNVTIPNSGQFENNIFNDFETGTRYVGLVDDIRITQAAIAFEKMTP